MIEKYIILISDNASFGMMYNPISKSVSLGGNFKFRLAMESVILDYFGVEIPTPVRRQANKIRYTFPSDGITGVISELESHGFVIHQVAKLGRLMI